MGRILNYMIVLLLVLWLAGMIFSAVIGIMIHLLLVLALIAVVIRIGYWWKERSARRNVKDMPRS